MTFSPKKAEIILSAYRNMLQKRYFLTKNKQKVTRTVRKLNALTFYLFSKSSKTDIFALTFFIKSACEAYDLDIKITGERFVILNSDYYFSLIAECIFSKVKKLNVFVSKESIKIIAAGYVSSDNLIKVCKMGKCKIFKGENVLGITLT